MEFAQPRFSTLTTGLFCEQVHAGAAVRSRLRLVVRRSTFARRTPGRSSLLVAVGSARRRRQVALVAPCWWRPRADIVVAVGANTAHGIANQSVPRLIINDTVNFSLSKTAVSILVISNRNSFRLPFD